MNKKQSRDGLTRKVKMSLSVCGFSVRLQFLFRLEEQLTGGANICSSGQIISLKQDQRTTYLSQFLVKCINRAYAESTEVFAVVP